MITAYVKKEDDQKKYGGSFFQASGGLDFLDSKSQGS
jgi:hypothetical protein